MNRKATALKAKFDTTGIKRGDLCVTAQIHKVVGRFHDKLRVVTLFPECSVCAPKDCIHEHIMVAEPGVGGQQHLMKLKEGE